jgi:hypothetical protein
MKYINLLLAAISISIFANAQSEGASKLYGFKQVVIPGNIPKKIIEENGKEIKVEAKQHYNYFIYLVSSTSVTPTEIWLNGKAFSATAVSVSSPVEYVNPTEGNKTTVLVPGTNKKVLKISLSGEGLASPTSKGKSLASKNELVIIYKGGGKTYYKAAKKLTELDAAHMQ